MKTLAHGIAWRLEKVADRFRRTKSGMRVIEGYGGYATSEHLVLRGRVLTSMSGMAAQRGGGRLRSFLGMVFPEQQDIYEAIEG